MRTLRTINELRTFTKEPLFLPALPSDVFLQGWTSQAINGLWTHVRGPLLFCHFHEMVSFWREPLSKLDLFLWCFHDTFLAGSFVKRCDSGLDFSDELFLDEMGTDFFWSFQDEHFFFWIEPLMDFWYDPFITNWHKLHLSLNFFQPVPMKQTLGHITWQLLISQLPENCTFFRWDGTLVLWMENRWFFWTWIGSEIEAKM